MLLFGFTIFFLERCNPDFSIFKKYKIQNKLFFKKKVLGLKK